MDREQLLTLLKALLEQSPVCAVVEETFLFGRVPCLRVITTTHDMFIVRAEKV